MADAKARIERLRSEAADAIAEAADAAALEELRVRYLGRKAELTGILRGIGQLPAAERGPVGTAGNEAREALERLLEGRRAELEAAELEQGLAADEVDVTLPGTPPAPVGSRSLLIRTMREIEDVFVGLGYRVMEGPEVELDYYNFTALNHPPGHAARMAQDTFYVDPDTLDPDLRIEPAPTGPEVRVEGPALPSGPEDVLLRTHTSPMQVRAMEAQEPPIFIVVPGRCYRSDPFDATHSPIFHQVEGLAVADSITLADLKGTLDELARALFGPERKTRFRPGFFPFTEPSVEVDVSCFRCGGSGQLSDGSRDPICKGTGWIEILGSGMVDPNVFGFVKANGYDPERIQGFAFGMGIERIAMLKHGVPDLRKFFENDVRVLEQFRVRVPYFWLREYCDPGLAVEELGELLALRTTELERISYVGPPSADGFVVGKVLSVERHPNADRLTVCEVETGGATRTIVCGAPNVAAGQTVPVALPGAVLPGGRKLGRAELRGVTSDGMILSEAELQIGDDADGIAVLAGPSGDPAAPGVGDEEAADSDVVAAPGSPLAEVLPLAEPVLELEVSSNRVDCLGVYGVAREVHAFSGASLAEPPWNEDVEAAGEGEASDYASVTVEVPELCPRFTARVFTEVTIGPSPLWLKARLVAAGQRPINNVVDLTNYVMLLTAQPLHAFDLDRVPDGALIVRTAADGEKLTTLDGVERTFDAESVLVCDRNGPSGIAGIMGGQISEVSSSTTRVLLEAATWNGVNILRTSRKLGLRSEASNRFEKQLHPELAIRAQRIASKLMVEMCGAKLVPGTIDAAAELPAARRVRLRPRRADSLLGMRIAPELCATYLERLGFGVEREGDDLMAEVPAHRYYDVSREADLVEEVGRIHGYDEHLPATLPQAAGQGGRLSREQVLRRRAEDVMRDLGFDAVVSLSLADPGLPGRLRLSKSDFRRAPIRVSNPLSLEHSELRTTLLGSLLDTARYNLARGAERVALFESGRAYLAQGRSQAGGVLGGEFAGRRRPPAFEPHCIAALAAGPLAAPSWGATERPTDFFTLKGILEALAAQLGASVEFEPEQHPFLHPGRAARVLLGGLEAGWLGEVHPLVCREWDLEAATAFQIHLAELVAGSCFGFEPYEDVTTYPAVHQDLAIVVGEDVPAARVREAVLAGGGELLRSATVFDLYRGEQVGAGRKSLALRLEFRAGDRTLTDAEVAERREAIKAALTEIGGSLRE